MYMRGFDGTDGMSTEIEAKIKVLLQMSLVLIWGIISEVAGGL